MTVPMKQRALGCEPPDKETLLIAISGASSIQGGVTDSSKTLSVSGVVSLRTRPLIREVKVGVRSTVMVLVPYLITMVTHIELTCVFHFSKSKIFIRNAAHTM